MIEWRLLLIHGLTVFNILFACYFVGGNGMYTLLMLLSLISVWLNNRRRAYESLDYFRQSPVTPPVTIIIPAWNEEGIIIETVRAALTTDYPSLEMIVVDDGSTDWTLNGLIEAFGLSKTDGIYRPHLATRRVKAIYQSPLAPRLVVIHKERGGKSDALNAGINLCRTPYFCTLDADCVLERDALLRLMRPIIRSRANTIASGGIVRILNGCEVRAGQVVRVGLPATRLQRFQVVEYLRSFLFGRTGWDVLRATVIMSGAFTVFHRETVMEAGGFSLDTVTEDMELIVRLRRWAVDHHRKIKMAFTSDSVCWTDSPASLGMLARQRRRWQVGLCQTLWKNSEMLFNPKYGPVGLLSYPFHLYVEALGAVVEFLGYLLIPFALVYPTAGRLHSVSGARARVRHFSLGRIRGAGGIDSPAIPEQPRLQDAARLRVNGKLRLPASGSLLPLPGRSAISGRVTPVGEGHTHGDGQRGQAVARNETERHRWSGSLNVRARLTGLRSAHEESNRYELLCWNQREEAGGLPRR